MPSERPPPPASRVSERPSPSDDPKASTPQADPQATSASAADDLKKGFEFLFKAARTAASSVPTQQVEDAVRGAASTVERAIDSLPKSALEAAFKLGVKGVESVARSLPVDAVGASVKSGAREVGRAFGSVADAVERTVGSATSRSRVGKPKPEDTAPHDPTASRSDARTSDEPRDD